MISLVIFVEYFMRIDPSEQLEELIIPSIQAANAHWSLSRKEKSIASASAQIGPGSQALDDILHTGFLLASYFC